ncbi:hypothetical protein QCK_1705 [Clostridioides difficile CD45]|nr:hypothetical protein [Clostridioides difficile]EQE65912.1 hypothetical protein QCK_1705 [Clostridioides difficile CD45]MDC9209737.1 hypothetical protein [Clostridioides difficile]MDC9228663.1 hypothetical protein [Clostridioides difficile]MDI7798050.1 hypothetical protein [Clostridioides difficile]MDL0236822.1 hypothetical protein [Clostridioides difficile]
MGILERRKNKKENKFNIIKKVLSFILLILNIALTVLRLIKQL